MSSNERLELEANHAFLSPSKYYWINYDVDKLVESYRSFLAAQRGTMLHDFASRCIKLGQKLPGQKKTLNMFVNDAIGYKMDSERRIYYSDYCFGTADAISFRRSMLRIHDLKTGKIAAHMEQLMIYAALYCLENRIKPGDIQMELRIYQNDEILYHNPQADEIAPIMDKIVSFDKIIRQIDEREG